MRQGQQNRRNRGRGRSSNRSNNPLSRNYESNGPEVKIKGSAAHIAEKYMALARDALSAGNPVTAENYFQHAEHYHRIIQAAQAKQEEHAAVQAAKVNNGKSDRQTDRRPRPPKEDTDASAKSSDSDAGIPGTGDQPSITSNGNADAPVSAKPKRKPRPRKPKATPGDANEGKDATDGSGDIIA